jgi:hypothetical protein
VRQDPHTRAARIVADVEGLPDAQWGRTVWLKSAGEYPNLKALATDSKVDFEGSKQRFPVSSPSARPLEGFVVAEFSNVIAGPACGRMLVELGATQARAQDSAARHHGDACVAGGAAPGPSSSPFSNSFLFSIFQLFSFFSS